MSAQPERLHAVVRGQVQGVSFRYYTQAAAQRQSLTGWVRNRRDGTVEVIAEGPRAALEHLLTFLQHGPADARVAAVSPTWSPATGEFRRFDIQ